MSHLSIPVLLINNFQSSGLSELITYLEQTPVGLTQSHCLPDDLTSYQVIILDPFQLEDKELSRLSNFVSNGGGCLGMRSTNLNNNNAVHLFGALPANPGSACDVRILFTDHMNPLGERLPDYFYAKGVFTPLEVQASEVEVVLYADWRYTHQPMLTFHSQDKGIAALTTIHDLSQPIFKRIFYRILRQLAGLENPRKPLRVGLLGYPLSVGDLHAQATAIGTPGLLLRSICDLDQARLTAAREKFIAGDVVITPDSSDLVNDSEIDVVIIATPPNSHAKLAIQMLESGKHVVVEKPLALNTREVEAMRKAAEKGNLLVACHQNRRWDDDYRAIKSALDQGLIGELFFLETFIGGFGHPCGYWHSEESVSGGIIYDWGAHYLDWMLDLIPGRIRELRSTRQKRLWHDVTNADQERIQLRYENDCEAEFTHSDLAFIPKPKWYLMGTQGTIIGNWKELKVHEDDPLRYYRTKDIPPAELGADLVMKRMQGREQIIEQNLPAPLKVKFPFHHNLADHLLLGEPLVVPVEHTARVVAVLEAAKRSAGLGGRVEQVDI